VKVIEIQTIRNKTWSNYLWVQVRTDEGLVGLGETFRHTTSVATYIHDQLSEYLLGKDPRLVNAHANNLLNSGGNRFLGYPTRSVEIRANSAIDIALWDIKAKSVDLPLCDLLGGPVRSKIPIYNTCASPGYNSQASQQRARLVTGDQAVSLNRNDDLEMQIFAPGELAQSLLEEGINCMKIWPFDEAADKNQGARIGGADMDKALSLIAEIRDTVGNEMDIMLEYHGLWRQAPARQIIQEVDNFAPFWHEDPISMTEIDELAELRRWSKSPFAGSESHATSAWTRDALKAGAIDYIHYDIGWIGGISEALRVAHLAASYNKMIAPHDCTGPVVWAANLHLSLAIPNALILESVRGYYNGIYKKLVSTLPTISDGFAHKMNGSGLGTSLSEELLNHPDTEIQSSKI